MSPTVESDPVIDQFKDQGYVILRGFLEREVIDSARAEVETLADGTARNLLDAGKITDVCENEPFETRLTKVFAQCPDDPPSTYRPELHLAGIYGLFFHPALLDLAERILGPEVRLYPNYSVRPKLPDNEATLVLWHQDAGYTASGKHDKDDDEPEQDAETLRMCNVWTPLVPATAENGCMQFVPGTHKLGLVPHLNKKYYLEIEGDVLQPRLPEAVNVEMIPGDVVFFSNLLFHCGLPNHSGGIRWSCDWRYQDATQSTARQEKGHIARSRKDPGAAVHSAEEWTRLHFS